MNTSQSTPPGTAPLICLRSPNSSLENTAQWHHCYELFFLADGNLCFHLEEHCVHLKSGCGLFLPPHLLHSCHSLTQKPPDAFSILIAPEYFHSLSTMQTNLARFLLQTTPYAFFSFRLPVEYTVSFSQKCLILHNISDFSKYGNDILTECLMKELLLLLNTLPPHKINRKKDLLRSPSLLTKLLPYIRNHLDCDLAVRDLSTIFRHSEDYIHRCFQQCVGLSPLDYILLKRLHRACGLLSAGYPPTEACAASGFSDYVAFCKAFRRHIGTTPSEYQLRTIRYQH